MFPLCEWGISDSRYERYEKTLSNLAMFLNKVKCIEGLLHDSQIRTNASIRKESFMDKSETYLCFE